MRIDKRQNADMRPISIRRNVMKYAEGSAYIECGETKVLCTATVSLESPTFRDSKGWVTAEYNMLPRATMQRNKRDISSLKKNSRASEIERLIGRSLRACVNLDMFSDATIIIDCDVIQADGGTRTASINAGYVALYDAFEWMKKKGYIEQNPIKFQLAAISAGIVDNEVMVDLCYEEDSNAQVDLNIVMDSNGSIAEIQATGEKNTFNKEKLNEIIILSQNAIKDIMEIQRKCLAK
ncbi:MAG: ribonuclease PH [Clostridiaceae bacterium]|nr:ribonuclease PH [Clostridiaceae bacterium]